MKMKEIITRSMNGLTYGIFATIVVGVIIQQFGTLLGLEVLTGPIYQRLALLMGVGIGMGVAISLKTEGIMFLVIAVSGGIATSFTVNFGVENWFEPIFNNNPITAYLVVLLTFLIMTNVFRKKTPYDILLIPIVGVLTSVLMTFIVSYPIGLLMDGIYKLIEISIVNQPHITSIFIGLIFAFLITLPIVSSAGIAIAINIGNIPVAAAAAVVGTVVQMVGFAIQSRKGNNMGTILSIGLASSMFQFKNIIKKPIIWLPTLITSAVLPPILFEIFKPVFAADSLGAGMGTSGLVGILRVLDVNSYSSSAWLFVTTLILSSLLVVYLIDILFKKMKWYQAEDLVLTQNI